MLVKIDAPKMTWVESLAVSLAMGILFPLLLFTLGWWVTASLSLYQVLHISERGIALTAFTGLALGVALDLLYLRRWVHRFYNINMKLLTLVYLCCSVIAVSTFMGLPVGNLALGTLAGVYIGRREYHIGGSRESVSKSVGKVSLYTALVTGAEALPIGLLALNEDWVVEWMRSITGLYSWTVTGFLGLWMVVLLCVILVAVQFWCTKTMAWLAYGWEGREST